MSTPVPMHPFPGTALAALIVVLIGVVTLLGWLLRYVMSVLIPAQRDAFIQCLKEQREEHRQVLTALLNKLEVKQQDKQ